MSQTTVRAIAASEGMLLRDVRLRALREAPYVFQQTLAEVEGDPDEEWAEWSAELAADDRRSVALLAFGTDPAAPTGMAGAYLDREHDDEAVVWGVWGDPAACGGGAGRLLLEAVIAWPERRGFALLTLRVTETSEPAIRLYRSLGFAELGCRKPHAHLPGIWEVAMALPLDPCGHEPPSTHCRA